MESDKEWKSWNSDGRDYRVLAKEWIKQYEHPETRFDDALGMVHRVFKTKLAQSPEIVEYVIRIAAWKGPPKTSEQGRMLVELKNMAFDALMISFLEGAESYAPCQPFYENSELIKMVVMLLRERLPEIKHPQTSKRDRFAKIAEGFLNHWMNYGITWSPHPPETCLRIRSAVEEALPDMIRLTVHERLNVRLLSYRAQPNAVSERHDRLVLSVLTQVVTNNGSWPLERLGSMGFPGEQLFFSCHLHRKLTLRSRVNELTVNMKRVVASELERGMTWDEAVATYCKLEVRDLQALKDELSSLPTF